MARPINGQRHSLRRTWPWLLLTLLYWGSRLHNLEALPVFLDEGNHLYWARLVWGLQPFHAASDGRLLNVWWAALFWPFVGSLWLLRASGVLLTTLGFSGLIAFASRYYSRQAGVVAGAIYCLLPLATFFERLALADTLSPAFTVLLVWFSAQAVNQPHRRRWAPLAGFALAADLLSKLSNLAFAPVPALALLVFHRRRRWRAQAAATLLAYASGIAVLYPIVFVLRRLAQSDLGLDLLTLKASPALAEMAGRAEQTSRLVWEFFWTFFGPPLWIVGLAAIAVALLARRRASLYLGAILALALSALLLRTAPGFLEARFALAYAPLLVLLIAGGLAGHWNRLIAAGLPVAALAILVGLSLLAPGARFLWLAWTQPAALPLPARDHWEYIAAWPSGYGFREIAQTYEAQAQPVQLVTLDLGGRQRFAAYLPPDSPVRPVWISPDEFKNGRWPDPDSGPALLVLDHPKDDADLVDLQLNLTTVGTYPRPGGESWLTVYELERAP